MWTWTSSNNLKALNVKKKKKKNTPEVSWRRNSASGLLHKNHASVSNLPVCPMDLLALTCP